ncbi:MAG: hypothetical protein AAGF01_15075 [Cyanobacteria bacterium P01_G01_bin.38]
MVENLYVIEFLRVWSTARIRDGGFEGVDGRAKSPATRNPPYGFPFALPSSPFALPHFLKLKIYKFRRNIRRQQDCQPE